MPFPREPIAAKMERLTQYAANGCIEWTGPLYSNGYGSFSTGYDDKLAHRVAWELANGPIPEGMVVRHSCDNRKCVNPGHLLIGTQGDNMRDMIERGRAAAPPRGALSPRCILTRDMVDRIREARRNGESARSISAWAGVSPAHVSRVSTGARWWYYPDGAVPAKPPTRGVSRAITVAGDNR